MGDVARGLWDRVGPRGLALLFFGWTDLIYGLGLMSPISPPTSPGLVWISTIMSLDAWGTLWVTVGIVLMFGVFMREDSIAWAAAMLIKVLWGGLWLGGWLFAGVERGYVSAGIWLPAAGLVVVLAIWLPGGERRQPWILARKSH